jgi:hypothetical protein
LVQLIRVIDQDSAQIREASFDRDKAESKQDHSCVGLVIAEDQIAEILVVGQQDPSLGKRDRQNVTIVQGVPVIATADRNVVAFDCEESDEAEGKALVEQEPHCDIEVAASLGRGAASTSRWA